MIDATAPGCDGPSLRLLRRPWPRPTWRARPGSLSTVCTEVLSTRSFTLFATSSCDLPVGDQEDLPDDAALGDDLSPFLRLASSALCSFSLLLLRPDHEEVHDREHPGDEDEERRWASAAQLGQQDLMGEHGGGLRQASRNTGNS